MQDVLSFPSIAIVGLLSDSHKENVASYSSMCLASIMLVAP